MKTHPIVRLTFLVFAALPLGADDRVFRFAPPDGTRFVRTLTRTFRIEMAGMMRIETTVLRARFVFRETKSGFRLTMTPLSFRYLVNEHETPSPVWDLIREHDLHLDFNVVGKLTEVRGYEAIDREITKDGVAFSSPASDFSAHLDRMPIGKSERAAWNDGVLFWLSQSAVPGKPLSWDSTEHGFTGQPVDAHAEMKVLRMQSCGTARCASTIYTMTPNAQMMRQGMEERPDEMLDVSASETLEQLIEPATMLPHFERVTWRGGIASTTAEGTTKREVSLTSVSEFEYESPRKGSR